MWQPIETAPAQEILLVCNPAEGKVPVVAKRIAQTWFNVGIVPVGRTAGHYHLEPQPTHWMRIPEMPTINREE